MLKRSVAAIQQRLSPKKANGGQRALQDDEARSARRGFFKKAAIGAVSISGAAGLAKVVVDSVPQPDLQELYAKDGLAGERELTQREYVLMSSEEKEDMVHAFIDNYRDQG